MMLAFETAGDGPTVLLLHEGIVDSRVWDPQWATYAARYRVVRCDLPGFGRSPVDAGADGLAQSVVSLLDELGIAAARVVGASLGGRVALEIAVARPDLVSALVLVGAGLPGHEWSEAVQAYGEAEDAAVRRGDLDAATELNLQMWVDGPRRLPSDVEPAVREAVRRMQRDALELQAPHWDDPAPPPLVADLRERLGDIRVPTLVLTGDEDVDDIHRIADHLMATIPGARRATIAGAAHVPHLEQPAEFDRLVLAFLDSL